MAGLLAAEHRKKEKYKVPLKAHGFLGLQVIAISTDGEIGPDTEKMLTRWMRRYVQYKSEIAELKGAPRDEIVNALGLAFASLLTLQISDFLEDCRGPLDGGSAAAKRARPQVFEPTVGQPRECHGPGALDITESLRSLPADQVAEDQAAGDTTHDTRSHRIDRFG